MIIVRGVRYGIRIAFGDNFDVLIEKSLRYFKRKMASYNKLLKSV